MKDKDLIIFVNLVKELEKSIKKPNKKQLKLVQALSPFVLSFDLAVIVANAGIDLQKILEN